MNSFATNNIYTVSTPSGFERFEGIRKLSKECFKITFDNFSIVCSHNHILYSDDRPIFAEDILPNTYIQSKHGILRVLSTEYIGIQTVYDLVGVGKKHLYYTDSLISHNCNFSGSSYTLLSGTCLSSLATKNHLYEDSYGTKIYEEPIENHIYAIGVDTAKYGDGDYLSMQVLDVSAKPFKQVASFRKRDITYLNLVEPMYKLGTKYNDAMFFIENNSGDGQSAADLLFNNYEYENIFTEKAGIYGFRTTTKSRKLGLQNLKQLTEDGLLEIVDGETIAELQRFALKNGKYQAVDGYNDDAVMALVAALFFMQVKSYVDAEELHAFFKSEENESDDDSFVFGFMSDGSGNMIGF